MWVVGGSVGGGMGACVSASVSMCGGGWGGGACVRKCKCFVWLWRVGVGACEHR